METTATASDVVPASVADGRDLVRDRCLAAGTPAGTTAVAVLLTSELVTNALVHAASACRLQVTATASFVHVEVEDESTEVPRVLHPSCGDLHGRGLGLVDSLAGAWGVREVPGGKVVWVTVDAGPTELEELAA